MKEREKNFKRYEFSEKPPVVVKKRKKNGKWRSLPRVQRSWYKIEHIELGTIYAKGETISDALKWYQTSYRLGYKLKLEDVKYRTVHSIPDEFKEVRHYIADEFMDLCLPIYSDFYIQCKKHLLNGEIKFSIDLSHGGHFDLELMEKRPFSFVVKDKDAVV